MTHIHLHSIDSTNNFLKSYKTDKEDWITLVTADYQTAGRGQRGNSWEAEEGKNLVFSLLIHPRGIKASRIFAVSEVAALSICEALSELLGTEAFAVKWPNDIYHGDKKIAGILIETDLMGGRIENAVIGVGVNINQTRFVSDAPNPISLQQIQGRETNLQQAMESVTRHFAKLYEQLEREDFEGLHEHFKKRLYRCKGFFPYEDENGRFDAKIIDIEPTGHLILEDSEGERRRYAFKEVSFVIAKG